MSCPSKEPGGWPGCSGPQRASGKESAPAPAGTQLSSAVISGNKGNIQISNLEVPSRVSWEKKEIEYGISQMR